MCALEVDRRSRRLRRHLHSSETVSLVKGHTRNRKPLP
jgi:hypothetical protein